MMESLQDNSPDPCGKIDSAMGYESGANTARRKRMEIIRFKQIVSVAADLSTKRSRFLGSHCRSENEIEKEQVTSSKDEASLPSALLVNKLEHSSNNGLSRSATCPPQSAKEGDGDFSKVELMRSIVSDMCPPHGKLSLIGRCRKMEDALVTVPNFVSLGKNGCYNAVNGSDGISLLHFFGVYDGHGDAQASNYCKKRFHHFLAEEVMTVVEELDTTDYDKLALRWTVAIKTCFLKIGKEVGFYPNGKCSNYEGGFAACSRDTRSAGSIGLTAVVAVLSPQLIIIGNYGGCRAVISRAGKPIAVTRDEKSDIKEGKNMDMPITAIEHEVTVHKRTQEDECLILASDGLWDAVADDVACQVASKCFIIASKKCESSDSPLFKAREPPATVITALLAKLALARGSGDNISVIVVDLKLS